MQDRRRSFFSALFAGAILAAGMTLGGTALAKPGKGKAKGKDRGAKICQKLECSKSQRDVLAVILRDFHQASKADRQAMKRLSKDLATEFAKAKPSEKEMKRIRTQMGKHRAAIEKRAFEMVLDVHAELDAAQRKKLARMMERGGLRRFTRGGGKRAAQGSK